MLIFLCAFHFHTSSPLPENLEQARSKDTHIFVIWLLLYPRSSPYCGCQRLFVSHFQSPYSLPLGWTLVAKWSHCGNTQFDKCPGKWALLLLLKGKCLIYPTDNAAGFPTGVPSSRYECVMQIIFSQESQCRITSNRWEIKYWGMRTLNTIILTYFSIK